MFFSVKHPDRTVQTDQGEYLFFSGTSYLGMSIHSDFQEIVKEQIAIYGINYGSSRTSNLRLCVFDEVTDFICKWTGAEASLTMSSGFLAGQLVAQWIHQLAQQHYEISYAPHTHPAVFSGFEQPHHHPTATFETWAQEISEKIKHISHNIVLVANSVDALHAKVHDFKWIESLKLKEKQELICIIDDSHGIGVIGEKGSGVFSQLPDSPQVKKVVIASMGKALGLPAGIVMGEKEIIQLLQKSPFYSGASPTPPAFLAAFLKAQTIYQNQLGRLQKKIHYFSTHTAHLGLFQSAPSYPIFCTTHHQLYPYLLERQVLISSFPYPRPDSELITRVVLSSLHTIEDLEYLISLVKKFI